MSRLLISAALSLLCSAPVATVAAGDASWPARSVKVVVAGPPGDGSDLMARVVGQKAEEVLGQPLVLENKPGGGGILASMTAKGAPADGYTFLVGTAGSHAIGQAVYERPQYDALLDFAPVMLVNRLPNVCVVNASVPAKTLAEFIALAKKAPGRYTFGSGGNATSAHLTGEYLKLVAGVSLLHIPYKGGSGALQGVAAGQVDLFCGNLPPAMTQIRSGRVRPLAVTSAQRAPQLPDVPTVAESGYPGFLSVSWYGFFAPKGTPPEVVKRMNAALAEATRTPAVRQKLEEQGTEVIGSTPEEFGRFLAQDIQRWSKVARAAGIKL